MPSKMIEFVTYDYDQHTSPFVYSCVAWKSSAAESSGTLGGVPSFRIYLVNSPEANGWGITLVAQKEVVVPIRLWMQSARFAEVAG